MTAAHCCRRRPLPAARRCRCAVRRETMTNWKVFTRMTSIKNTLRSVAERRASHSANRTLAPRRAETAPRQRHVTRRRTAPRRAATGLRSSSTNNSVDRSLFIGAQIVSISGLRQPTGSVFYSARTIRITLPVPSVYPSVLERYRVVYSVRNGPRGHVSYGFRSV